MIEPTMGPIMDPVKQVVDPDEQLVAVVLAKLHGESLEMLDTLEMTDDLEMK